MPIITPAALHSDVYSTEYICVTDNSIITLVDDAPTVADCEKHILDRNVIYTEECTIVCVQTEIGIAKTQLQAICEYLDAMFAESGKPVYVCFDLDIFYRSVRINRGLADEAYLARTVSMVIARSNRE